MRSASTFARRRRRRGHDPLDPNLTPLLDVVLQLITFFMMLIHFGAELEGSTPRVRLPVAPAGSANNELAVDRLSVAIDRDGRLIVGDAAVDAASAEHWWREQAQQRGFSAAGSREGASPPSLTTQVIVRADRAAAYGSVRALLRAARAAGFEDFSLVVDPEARP